MQKLTSKMKNIGAIIFIISLILLVSPVAHAADSGASSSAETSQSTLFPDTGKYSIGLDWGNEYLGSFYLDSRYWFKNSNWGVDAGIGLGLNYGGGFGFHVEPMYNFYAKNPKFILYADADLGTNFGSYDYGFGSVTTSFWSLGVGAGVESDLGKLFDTPSLTNWGVFLQWNPLTYYDFTVGVPSGTGATNISVNGMYFGAVTAGFHYYF
ncbi:MAG: hypothetical protein ACYDBP_09060 [Leptospirales bacterium]